MGLFNNKSIKIKEVNRLHRYEMTMNSKYIVNNTPTISNVLLIWDLVVLRITDSGYRIRLQTLEHSLLDSNDSPLEDLFQATRAMMKSFSEIDVSVDFKGAVYAVHNKEDIINRFNRAKKELISFGGGVSMRAEEVYHVPEKDFEDNILLSKRINAMEFFDVYFGALYGYDLPKRYEINKDNLLKSIPLEYYMNGTIDPRYINSHFTKYIIEGDSGSVSKKKLMELYGDSPFIKKEDLNFDGKYDASYILNNQTGLIQEGNLKICEKLASNFEIEMIYNLKKIG